MGLASGAVGVLALIDRNFQGFGKELFTDAGKYVIHFGSPPAEAAEQVCTAPLTSPLPASAMAGRAGLFPKRTSAATQPSPLPLLLSTLAVRMSGGQHDRGGAPGQAAAGAARDGAGGAAQ